MSKILLLLFFSYQLIFEICLFTTRSVSNIYSFLIKILRSASVKRVRLKRRRSYPCRKQTVKTIAVSSNSKRTYVTILLIACDVNVKKSSCHPTHSQKFSLSVIHLSTYINDTYMTRKLLVALVYSKFLPCFDRANEVAACNDD